MVNRDRDEYGDCLALKAVFERLLVGEKLKLQAWDNGEVHFFMHISKVKAVVDAWEARGRGRPQDAQAETAA